MGRHLDGARVSRHDGRPGAEVRVAALSFAPRDNPWATLDEAFRLLKSAAERGASLVLLPEMWAGSSPFPEGQQALQAFARERGLVVAGSLKEVERGQAYHRMRLWGACGELACYTKLHPYPPEEAGVTPGDAPVLVAVGQWCAGLAICFDLNFPELFRQYALQGAELYLVSAAWPRPYAWLAEVFGRARAAENQAYLLLANRPGAPSMIVGPDGRLVGWKDDEGLLVGELDRGWLEDYRREFPLLAWRP